MSSHTTRARSIYRRILRELPARTPSLLANPSPMQKHIRLDFTTTTAAANASSTSPPKSLQHQTSKSVERQLSEAEQFIKYLAGQRMYTTLVDRYNPGMNMTDEDRVRLTARRVGMDLPLDMRGNGREDQ